MPNHKVNRGKIMKSLSTILLIVLINLPVFSQSTYTLNEENSKIVVLGTSSVHDWESNAEKFTGEASVAVTDGLITSIESLTVTVKADQVKSGKRVMDNKTKDALDAKNNPDIVFSLTGIQEVTDDSLTVTGTLTLAGVTKNIEMEAAYTLNSDGSFTVNGIESIDMEVYGIKPPTAMMGALKTGKDVDVKFDVTFTKSNQI